MEPRQEDRKDQGLPTEVGQNGEEGGPAEPDKRRPGSHEQGDRDSGGESGEGSQSTGSPDSAG